MNTQSHIAIHELRPHDQPLLAHQAAALVVRELRGEPTPTERGINRQLAAMENQVTVIAEDGERTLATASLEPRDDGKGVVRGVVADPHVRGAGLGKSVLAGVVGIAVELGMTDLELKARPEAEGFYKRLGWEPLAARGQPESLWYHKSLPRARRPD